MDISQLRGQIDAIDDEIVRLFTKRMEVSAAIAEYKKRNSLPIYVPAREQEKLADVAQKAGSDMAAYVQGLYETIFALSRSYQNALTSSADSEVV